MATVVREAQTPSSPALEVVTDDSGPAVRIRVEGTGNALEIVSANGVVYSIDKNGTVTHS